MNLTWYHFNCNMSESRCYYYVLIQSSVHILISKDYHFSTVLCFYVNYFMPISESLEIWFYSYLDCVWRACGRNFGDSVMFGSPPERISACRISLGNFMKVLLVSLSRFLSKYFPGKISTSAEFERNWSGNQSLTHSKWDQFIFRGRVVWPDGSWFLDKLVVLFIKVFDYSQGGIGDVSLERWTEQHLVLHPTRPPAQPLADFDPDDVAALVLGWLGHVLYLCDGYLLTGKRKRTGGGGVKDERRRPVGDSFIGRRRNRTMHFPR